MEGRFGNEREEEDSITAGSSFSDLEETYIPSPKKSKRSARKNVVTVPITNGGDGLRSRGEVYPPPDSWSWRKYGQKPIKGSPYPRGYYRCSSSKGCPAKKQVERSCLDPTTLLITYSCDHNHSFTTTITKNHHAPRTVAASVASTSHSSSTSSEIPLPNFPPEECAAFANQPDIEPDTNSFAEMVGEFGWLCDVGSTMMNRDTFVVGPSWADSEVEVFMPIGEEDEFLFGDLGDLPESAVVFRQSGVET